MVYRCLSIPLDSLLVQGAKEAYKCVSLNKAKLQQNRITSIVVCISSRVYLVHQAQLDICAFPRKTRALH